MSSGSSTSASICPIIAHVDLDCFYVQVERSHDASLKDKPVAVVQCKSFPCLICFSYHTLSLRIDNPFGDLKSYAASDNRLVSSGSIIAVSYEARARGVKRIMRGNEAKKACPEILLVQVPTSHGKADLTIYREASARILRVLGQRYGASVVIERASIDEVYLDLSIEAAKLLEREGAGPAFIAKAIAALQTVPTLIAGDDRQEAQMAKRDIRDGHAGTTFSRSKREGESSDGSNIVKEGEREGETVDVSLSHSVPDEILDDREAEREGFDDDDDDNNSLSPSIDEDTEDYHNSQEREERSVRASQCEESWFRRPHFLWTIEDQLLLAGALVTMQLRTDVLSQLGFTCSAGVAHNKMLAKLSSGMHKPSKQTLVPQSVVPLLMRDLAFSRIQGFGGKLGDAITQRFGESVRTMSDLLAIPRGELVRAFGEETTQWIVNRARGTDTDKVQDRALPITIGCSKSFRGANTLPGTEMYAPTDKSVVYRWLTELAGELCERVSADTAMNRRTPKQLGVSLSIVPYQPNRPSNGIGRTNVPTDQRIADWVATRGLSLSKVSRFPYIGSMGVNSPETVTAIAKNALSLAIKAVSEKEGSTGVPPIWGIGHLGLAATQFEQVECGRASIASFFTKTSNRSNNTTATTSTTDIGSVKVEREEGLVEGETIVEEGLVGKVDAAIDNYDDVFGPDSGIEVEEEVVEVVSNNIPNNNNNNTVNRCLQSPVRERLTLPSTSSNSSPMKTSNATTIHNTTSSNAMSIGGITRNNFIKYFPDGDYDVFIALPSALQSELLNSAMFSAHSTGTTTNSNSTNGGNNSVKKR